MNRRTAAQLALAGMVGWTGRRGGGLAWAGQQAKPMPQFSCMLWTLEGKAPFDRCLEMVAAAGYGGVELVGEFQKWSPAEMQRVMGRLKALRLVVDAASGVKTGFAVAGQSEAFVAELKAQLASMQAMACKRVILLSGAVEGGMTAAQQRAVALSNLARAADLAEAAGVEVLIEPIDVLENPTSYLRSVAEGFSLVRELKRPQVRVLYDLYHEQRGAGNLLEKLESNVDLVGLVHVADVPGRHEPGTGEIAYPKVYETLARLRYDRWIAMEFYPTGDPVQALRTARVAVEAAYRV